MDGPYAQTALKVHYKLFWNAQGRHLCDMSNRNDCLLTYLEVMANQRELLCSDDGIEDSKMFLYSKFTTPHLTTNSLSHNILRSKIGGGELTLAAQSH